MKKVGLFVLGLCLMATASFAGGGVMPFKNKYFQEVYNKVKAMKILTHNDMWSIGEAYNYSDEYKGKSGQDSKNLYYGAKTVAKQNSKNFNAQFNYAILTYGIITNFDTADNGYQPSKTQSDEGYKLLVTKVKPLAKTKNQEYTVLNAMIANRHQRYFGTWLDEQLSDRPHEAFYRDDMAAAREMLALHTERFNLVPNLEDALENRIICQALHRMQKYGYKGEKGYEYWDKQVAKLLKQQK